MPTITVVPEDFADANYTDDVRDTLRLLLHEGPVTVTFEKVDGSLREMTCTLNESFLPVPTFTVEPAKPRKENPAVMPVFDIETQEWRSFRINSVKEIKYAENV